MCVGLWQLTTGISPWPDAVYFAVFVGGRAAELFGRPLRAVRPFFFSLLFGKSAGVPLVFEHCRDADSLQ